MKLKLTIPGIVLVILCIVTSCSKGPKGDAGAAGAAGPQGIPGAAGPAGPAGAPGTANVIYSDWIDTTTWRPDTTMTGSVIDTLGFFANISASKLDSAVLNTGEMKVYVKVNTASAPLVSPVPYNDGRIFIDVLFHLNTIQLTSNAKLTGIPFRYILIPGGTKSGRFANGGRAINWNDYNEVKKYLGLKD